MIPVTLHSCPVQSCPGPGGYTARAPHNICTAAMARSPARSRPAGARVLLVGKPACMLGRVTPGEQRWGTPGQHKYTCTSRPSSLLVAPYRLALPPAFTAWKLSLAVSQLTTFHQAAMYSGRRFWYYIHTHEGTALSASGSAGKLLWVLMCASKTHASLHESRASAFTVQRCSPGQTPICLCERAAAISQATNHRGSQY